MRTVSGFLPAFARCLHGAGMRLAMCAGIWACASCADDDLVDSPRQTDRVCFGVSVADKWTDGSGTRADGGDAQTSAASGQTASGGASALADGSGSTPASVRYESQHFDDSSLWLITRTEAGIYSPTPDTLAAQTRGTIVTESTLSGTFGVYAYAYTQGSTWSGSSTDGVATYIDNAPASGDATASTWYTTPTYFWPGSQRDMAFLAYAPYADGTSGSGEASLSIADYGTSLNYTVASAVGSQQDLLLATATGVSGGLNTSQQLTFKHLLTAVKVKAKAGVKGTVTSISLSGVAGSGTYTIDMTGSGTTTAGWTLSSSSATSTYTVTKTDGGTALDASATTDTEIAGDTDATTFLMIPQTLGEGATLSVTMTDESGIATTLSASLSGKEWPTGHTVTYIISTTEIVEEYVFSVTAPKAFSYTGGTSSYTVSSYTDGTEKAIGWTAEFVEGDETSGYTTVSQPTWITAFTSSGTGTQTCNISVAAQTADETKDPDKILQSRDEVGSSSSYYNLASSTGSTTVVENTANCYVVNAPGYYCIPLVFGNGIKNGAANTAAYSTSNTGDNILSNFVDYSGTSITSPWIDDINVSVTMTPYLVWQDVEGLVTLTNTDMLNVDASGFTGSKPNPIWGYGTYVRYLRFEIPKSKIAQGNAVIAIKDGSSNIRWSWHIWVTDEGLDNDLQTITTDGTSYSFLPINLGWGSKINRYQANSVKVRFTQKGNEDNPQIITINQTAWNEFEEGNHPYYQWGRKDPTLPISRSASTDDVTNKTWYDADGNASTTVNYESTTWPTDKGIARIKYAIANPGVFSANSWMDEQYYNLWDAANAGSTSNTPVKSIYDPCPVGYRVPSHTEFDALYKAFDVDNAVDRTYGIFYPYTTADGEKDYMFFSKLGMRIGAVEDEHSPGEIVNKSNAYSWSSTPFPPNITADAHIGFAYLFHPQWKGYYLYNFGRAAGMPVRPLKE